MRKFSEDPQLGVAGTPFHREGYDSAKDSFEGENHVAGGCQLLGEHALQISVAIRPTGRAGLTGLR